jgi:hypothetical protein
LIASDESLSDGGLFTDGGHVRDVTTHDEPAPAGEAAPIDDGRVGSDTDSPGRRETGVERDAGDSGSLDDFPDASPCVVASDCDALLGPTDSTCMGCPSGSDECGRWACVSGVCHETWCGTEPLASSTECERAADCTALLGPLNGSCMDCSGTDKCTSYVCLSGICQTTWCGAEPFDGPTECEVPADCEMLLGPLNVTCIGCPGDDMGCTHYACVRGICEMTWCK